MRRTNLAVIDEAMAETISRNAAVDAMDLKLANTELEAGREMLAKAHAITDRRERDEAIKTAVGRLALAARTIDMVVDRRA